MSSDSFKNVTYKLYDSQIIYLIYVETRFGSEQPTMVDMP